MTKEEISMTIIDRILGFFGIYRRRYIVCPSHR